MTTDIGPAFVARVLDVLKTPNDSFLSCFFYEVTMNYSWCFEACLWSFFSSCIVCFDRGERFVREVPPSDPNELIWNGMPWNLALSLELSRAAWKVTFVMLIFNSILDSPFMKERRLVYYWGERNRSESFSYLR